MSEFRANDPEQVKKQKDKLKRKLEQQETDIKELLELPSFRRFLWGYMNETCGILRSPFQTNGSMQTQLIGMQDAARALLAQVEAVDPLIVPQMMTEYHEMQK